MKTKRGISLVVLAITIIVMVIIASVTIAGIDNVMKEATKSDFIVELGTIQDKVEEWYLLTGSLPVKAGVEYTANQLKAKVSDVANKTLLASEISANKDTNNTFFVVDLALMEIETSERGKSQEQTDIFVVATNTLNVYYLSGVEVYDVVRFSLVNLVDEKEVEGNLQQSGTQVALDTQLSLIKNTNVWRNELSITIKNSLEDGETLNYSIGGATVKEVTANNVIKINASNMTDAEKTAFATNKQLTVNKLQSGSVVETKQISIANLDITDPELGTIEVVDTSDENYNTIKINSSDEGGSGVKALYYDYVTKIVDGVNESYYTDRSEVTEADLINFGKITVNGVIKLEKNISTIDVMGVDSAGNMSEITTYTITID